MTQSEGRDSDGDQDKCHEGSRGPGVLGGWGKGKLGDAVLKQRSFVTEAHDRSRVAHGDRPLLGGFHGSRLSGILWGEIAWEVLIRAKMSL
jgi:hypothetical protein